MTRRPHAAVMESGYLFRGLSCDDPDHGDPMGGRNRKPARVKFESDMAEWRCPKCGHTMTANYHTYAVNCWCEQPPVRMEKVDDTTRWEPGAEQRERENETTRRA